MRTSFKCHRKTIPSNTMRAFVLICSLYIGDGNFLYLVHSRDSPSLSSKKYSMVDKVKLISWSHCCMMMVPDQANEDPFNIKCVDYQTTAMAVEAVSQLGHSIKALYRNPINILSSLFV